MHGSASKNCHISDLKITKCTHPAGECRTRLWKTQWRMLNSTGKTGFKAGLLHVLHRVFNLWKKKSGPSTECIALFCGKLFGPAKRQVPAGAEGAAARDNSAKPGRGAGKLRKIRSSRQKAAICWQTRSAYAILYLGLSSDKIVGLAACASGAARPGEHALHRSDRNGRRT